MQKGERQKEKKKEKKKMQKKKIERYDLFWRSYLIASLNRHLEGDKFVDRMVTKTKTESFSSEGLRPSL